VNTTASAQHLPRLLDPEVYHKHLTEFPSLAYTGYSGHMRGHLDSRSVQGRNYASRLEKSREQAETHAQKSKYSQEKSLMDLVAEAEEAKKRGN
jgi:hypothetical protein